MCLLGCSNQVGSFCWSMGVGVGDVVARSSMAGPTSAPGLALVYLGVWGARMVDFGSFLTCVYRCVLW